MSKIKTVYYVHHSHTDIGYTDLQEIIISRQVEYIHTVLEMMKKEENQSFRWNCETYYCVERFLETAAQEEINEFFQLVKASKIGISGTYLNFNDLVDSKILKKRSAEISDTLKQHNITLKTAMNADINGISMGQRDALLSAGVEFLFTNIHTHHGMFPLGKNQNAYWWHSDKLDKKLLVWNGEHYNLGNFIGFYPKGVNSLDSAEKRNSEASSYLSSLRNYLNNWEEDGYPHDFIISGISGIFSDNAPPNADVLKLIETCNQQSDEVELKMVSLQELYAILSDKLALDELPVYHGDLTDWWANGVGSDPYAAKHYRSAQQMYHLAGKLWSGCYDAFPVLTRTAEDNFLLYAEHTYGHSATISNPYDTMVLDLDNRKSSYASKAHEASAMLLEAVKKHLGNSIDYYKTSGKTVAFSPSAESGSYPVEFYIETPFGKDFEVINESTNEKMTIQLSPHPRGTLISFVDAFSNGETNRYHYREIPAATAPWVRRQLSYEGTEQMRDLVNLIDVETYQLPYQLENEWFKISYKIGEGITSFYNKLEDKEMLGDGLAKFFTPVYERTEIRTNIYEERRLLGRNIRGKHAEQFQGKLTDVKCIENGPVFTQMIFSFQLEGTEECFLNLKLYKKLPKLEFSLCLAKQLSKAIESVFLPLSLTGVKETFLNKGNAPFRPGIDQLPGSCMEYWITDLGAVSVYDKSQAIIKSADVPLIYMGELAHHPIVLCDNKPENNQRSIYSWIMNNTWETNFKLNLAGFCEFRYSLELSELSDIQKAFDKLEASHMGAFTIIHHDN